MYCRLRNGRTKEMLSETRGVVLELDNNSNLFEYIKCMIMPDNTYELVNSRISRRNKGKILHQISKSCHKYSYSGRQTIYICARDSSFTSDVDMLDFDPNLRKIKDTSVVVRVLKADEFKFSML